MMVPKSLNPNRWQTRHRQVESYINCCSCQHPTTKMIKFPGFPKIRLLATCSNPFRSKYWTNKHVPWLLKFKVGTFDICVKQICLAVELCVYVCVCVCIYVWVRVCLILHCWGGFKDNVLNPLPWNLVSENLPSLLILETDFLSITTGASSLTGAGRGTSPSPRTSKRFLE